MDNLSETVAVLESKVKAIEEKQDEILALQKTMQEQLARYKGFFGGMVFVFSAFWAFVLLGWDVVKFKLGMK